jgi:hypothetical protein
MVLVAVTHPALSFFDTAAIKHPCKISFLVI